MNIDSKEFASILRISAQSTNTARYRLRKRLGLLEEESLENFVLTYLN
jgi:DNA-binding CsgD family transcriptional regulator